MSDDEVKPEQWPPRPQVDFTRTQAVRAAFGRNWQTWLWLRNQFSSTSLGLVGLLLATCAGYLLRLETRMSEQNTEIQILKARMPSGDYGVPKLSDDLSRVRENNGVLSDRIDRQDAAIQRIYDNLDLDYISTMPERAKRRRAAGH